MSGLFTWSNDLKYEKKEGDMRFSRTVLSLTFLILAVIFPFARAFPEPVLLKLFLKEPDDWSDARATGVVAYQRFEDFVLAEYERTKLGELDRVGLKYQIIDRDPWSAEYFLVSRIKGAIKADLKSYGEILLKDTKWQLIKTSRGKAFELSKEGYVIVAIHRNPIPLKYKHKPPLKVTQPALKYYSEIDSLVNLVSAESLYTWDLRLQNFQTRYSYTDSVVKARDWLYDKFLSFGIDSVWLHHYYWDSHQWNVVATVVGTARPDRVIVVGGHYDSVVYGGLDPYVWAPGADDNGSGTVATLEMARIIAQNPLPVTVIFVPFAQEEQGLVGSNYFAGHLYSEGAQVELMINCDMIGHTEDSDPDVEIDGAPEASTFVNLMMDMAATYTYLNPFYGGFPSNSDHYSFYQWGYDAVFASEGDFFWNGWHTSYDVADSLDFDYMKEVVKMCLATLYTVGNSPSPVEDLKVMDAGDGQALYLSWSANHPAENVAYYKVYFGTTSGNYDSLHQVTATADTLRNLIENTTYYITVSAVNAEGFESIMNQEISAIPRVVPQPPSGLSASPFGTYKIKLTWLSNQEADLDYYNIYKSEQSGGGYTLLSGACRDTTFVDSAVSGEVGYYYYTLTAVDTSGNESQMSEEVEGFAVTLDQGVLVVDETYENIAYNMVNSDSINAFYERALQDYTHSYVDNSCPSCPPYPQISLRELGRYEVVIVHSEDNRGNRSLGYSKDSTYLVLKEYLDYGGKVIIEGRRNLSRGDDGDWEIRQFLPGDVPYDYLKIKSAYVPPWSPSSQRTEEFIGATSLIPGYPNLEVDSLRVAQCSGGLELEGKVPGVGYIDSLMAGEVIYTFRSAYDTSNSGGKPVAFRYLGKNYEFIFFDFPLYFISEPQAIQLLHRALSDLGVSTHIAEDDQSQVSSSFVLRQNFPNPFNSETIIEYYLPEERVVKIEIYNILGQKVKTLLDRKQSSGNKRIVWDGKNEKGQEVSSGIYFYRVKAGKLVRTKKMLLLK